MVLYLKEEMKRNELAEHAVIGLLWTCIMNAVEWNKKEELVAEQALKHLKVGTCMCLLYHSTAIYNMSVRSVPCR